MRPDLLTTFSARRQLTTPRSSSVPVRIQPLRRFTFHVQVRASNTTTCLLVQRTGLTSDKNSSIALMEKHTWLDTALTGLRQSRHGCSATRCTWRA